MTTYQLGERDDWATIDNNLLLPKKTSRFKAYVRLRSYGIVS